MFKYLILESFSVCLYLFLHIFHTFINFKYNIFHSPLLLSLEYPEPGACPFSNTSESFVFDERKWFDYCLDILSIWLFFNVARYGTRKEQETHVLRAIAFDKTKCAFYSIK